MSLQCDFCLTPVPQPVRFRATSFVSHAEEAIGLPHLGITMNDDWAACAMCAMLIYADRWEELAERSTDQHMEMGGLFGMPRGSVLLYVRALHDEFRRARL